MTPKPPISTSYISKASRSSRIRKSSNRTKNYGTHPEQTSGGLLSWGKRALRTLGPRESQFSAERLLEEATGLNRSEIYLEADRRVLAPQAAKYRRWIDRRKKREPVAYIIKKAAFWEETLIVNRHCLIPRPETEILVERFIDKSGFKKTDSFRFLDLGCGSGAIAIALLRYFPNASATLTDISREVLHLAKRNLNEYALLPRCEVRRSDLFQGLGNHRWDALVSNPPYFADQDWRRVEKEIYFEPKEALAAGDDGLIFYRRIASEASQYLGPDAPLFLEVGKGQAKRVKVLFSRNPNYGHTAVYKDYQGIDRVVMAQRS